MTENGVHWRHALVTGAVVLLGAYVFLKLVLARGNALPQNSWFALIAIVLLSLAVLAGGWEVRAYLRGNSTRPPSATRARRALVASQACVLAGAALSGWFAGYALIELGRLDASSAPAGLRQAAALLIASLAAVGVGFLVQHWCRIPDDDDEHTGGGSVRS